MKAIIKQLECLPPSESNFLNLTYVDDLVELDIYPEIFFEQFFLAAGTVYKKLLKLRLRKSKF